MGIGELLLIGIGLSMDAFAASVCQGLKMRKISPKQTLIIALFFGSFQALMPLIGWVLGKQFETYITSIDHWIAFVLLAFIGGKMVFDALKQEDGDKDDSPFSVREIFLLAIATSIDALAFLQTNIWVSIGIIGCTTFLLSAVGVFIGHKFGAKHKNKAELAGGIILILIGLKILLEHLGVISF